jgi:hypothetical protein
MTHTLQATDDRSLLATAFVIAGYLTAVLLFVQGLL